MTDLSIAKPLPAYLVQRYHGWRATDYTENRAWYRRLADEGQRPRCMVISCCDSRVHVNSLFGAQPGEFFAHRNIANLVPPYETGGEHHGTSAAIEFAVLALRIPNLIIMGHSECGGAQGCYEMCTGKNPELEAKESFVGRWMDILRPGYERVKDLGSQKEILRGLEKQSVVVSMENLLTFPFIAEAIANGTLAVHGVYSDIGTGDLEVFDPAAGRFEKL